MPPTQHQRRPVRTLAQQEPTRQAVQPHAPVFPRGIIRAPRELAPTILVQPEPTRRVEPPPVQLCQPDTQQMPVRQPVVKLHVERELTHQVARPPAPPVLPVLTPGALLHHHVLQCQPDTQQMQDPVLRARPHVALVPFPQAA
jgi:hypothetical protein